MKTVLSLIFILSLFSCATPARGPEFAVTEAFSKDKSSLYIYRPKLFYNGGAYSVIEIENQAVSLPLKNGGFPHIILNPGKVELAVIEGKNWVLGDAYITLATQPWATYLLRITPILDSFSPLVSAGFTQVSIAGHIDAKLVEPKVLPRRPRWRATTYR